MPDDYITRGELNAILGDLCAQMNRAAAATAKNEAAWRKAVTDYIGVAVEASEARRVAARQVPDANVIRVVLEPAPRGPVTKTVAYDAKGHISTIHEVEAPAAEAS